mmetsp:Transcript_39128/g.87538  ORF Transcript_39128/g.87538 Transcript_39128/m.87538 type:complete len:672 (-) Transcript_39128:215-2230(-)
MYMERIRDLLDQFGTKVNLTVREDPRSGVFVAGVTEEYVTCEQELLDVMKTGAKMRATAATGMNEGSSRSHSVFMVTVHQRNLETSSQRTGKLFLVDLAGSEMIRKTHATGQQLEEAKTINKSLSALGLVINALTEDKAKGAHIPYRDSKLTRVLQDSLGGNAKTALLINCSPSSFNANETLSTLRFGSRAKAIKNKPKINEQRSVEELSGLLQRAENAIDMQQSYIMALEGQLELNQERPQGDGSSSTGPGHSGDSAGEVALQQRMAALTADLGEEREERERACGEVEKLSRLLRDKDKLVGSASGLLAEAAQHLEEATKRADKLEELESKASDEAAAAQEALQAAELRFQFDGSELKVRVETLQGQVEKLTAELEAKEELEAQEAKRKALASGDSMTRSESDVSLSSIDDTQRSKSPPPPPSASAGAAVRLLDLELAVQLSEGEAEALQGLGLSAEALALVKSREAKFEAAARAALAKALGGVERGAANEATTARLEKDLQAAAERNLDLEMQLSQLKSAGGAEAEKVLSSRERSHMRMQKKFESLQQRLEQLVAVHRQLLRKYAALELDNAEDKKKISLRDERIGQLEANTRALATNMKAQAARHVVELTKLREQVSSVRQEQIEARLHEATAGHGHAHGHPAVIRGGGIGGGDVRAIRGGARPTVPR